MTNISRRKFIITSSVVAVTSILAHGCSSSNSDSAKTDSATSSNSKLANNSPKVETTTAKLGFIALTDSAPLIIAKEKGFFTKYGMTDVEISKQNPGQSPPVN